MGFPIKFNWVLQITPPEPIELSHVYPFEKSGNRIFPTTAPIDLIDPDRNAIAKIKIKSVLNENEITTGTFEIIKIYADEEKRTLTNYWIENQ